MKILAYKIESGWPNVPVWYCPVVLKPEIAVIDHLHTTRSVNEAPTVFSGKVSGLLFRAHGNLFPIESREGYLVMAESEKTLETMTNQQQSDLKWKNVSINEAIALLDQ
jgi:hypothetical protein